MAKRFTDTEKWKKKFIKKLDPKFKLLWVYILDECNHAGIWEVELEIAGIRLGFDYMDSDPLIPFKGYITEIDNGDKWFIRDFIEFQYGKLNPDNRVHASVISLLKNKGVYKGLTRPLQGAMDKDKDKSMDKDKDKEAIELYELYPKKVGKMKALASIREALKVESFEVIKTGIENYVQAVNGNDPQYTAMPATWFNNQRWTDEGMQTEWPNINKLIEKSDYDHLPVYMRKNGNFELWKGGPKYVFRGRK